MSDFIAYSKALDKFSARSFAKAAGFGSQSYLQMIVDGKRELSAKSAIKIAEGFELNKREASYFELLVKFNRARELSEQNSLYEELQGFKKSELASSAQIDCLEFYRHWHNVVIYEALPAGWTKPNIKEFASNLKIRDYKVEKSLELLVRLGLLEESGGQYKKKDAAIKTEEGLMNLFIRNFHEEMIKKALGHVREEPADNREFGSLTISLSKDNFEKFVLRMRQFREEINQVFSSDQNADEVYQFNLQLFSVMKIPQKE